MILRIFDRDDAAELLRRKPLDEFPVSAAMRARTIATFGEGLPPDEVVRRILRDVRERGDAALIEWTRRLEGVELTPERFALEDLDLAGAYDAIDPEVVAALEQAAERIAEFHARIPAQSWMNTDMGGMLGQVIRPLDRVGIYIPGGSAPLASTLLMTAIPARQAGVEEIVVCAPPMRATGQPHPLIQVAADLAGATEVLCLGGVAAIGAMAYGTESIDRVDKIFGPGNTFVMLAKKQVYGVVGIDALPGPTETVIVADDGANPAWVAADLLAQAEHTTGTAILVTPSRALAAMVGQAIESQVAALPEASATEIRDSFAHRSGAVITESLAEAVAVGDAFAPEHLCLSVREPWAWLDGIRHAGGVFMGEHSYEVLGDYCAGPSHVMPTGGTARFTPPCNVMDFMRVMNVIGLDESTARGLAPVAIKLAEAEGLSAHAAAARLRLK